ncbi:MAG: glycosyltransferase family 4 protein, partial [Bacteroidota bacterium]
MKVAYIGTYPPRKCGIGTFTQNLVRAVFTNQFANDLSQAAEVLALSECEAGEAYPAEVSLCISDQDRESFLAASAYLNDCNADVVVLQHEYGIFGGQDGAFVLSLLDELEKPSVAIFHTVLKSPSYGQKFVLQRVAAKVNRVVVMTRMAKQFLHEIYKLPEHKVVVIEHGVPNIQTESREVLRQKLGFKGHRVLFTFGLLGRGKGIETVINALPGIVEQFPETRYVVLGKTHPANLRHAGEEYREYLLDLAAQKGVADNVQFINSFAEEQELWEHLQACDVYLTPYVNEAQITSGTLAYAIGAGAAIVSTPFWHAQELLAEDRGQLFDFRHSEQLAQIVTDLFNQPEKLETMRSQAAAYGKKLKWNLIGKQYLHLFQQVLEEKIETMNDKHKLEMSLPPVNFKHVHTLTDSTGILQHAKFSLPNRHEGYCLDDNARALIAVLMGRKLNPGIWLENAANTYLGFIYHCQREDGLFRNFMSYDRRFLEIVGSEDSFGRAVWSVGYAMAHPVNGGFYSLAKEIFDRATPQLSTIQSPRSIAFAMMGIYHALQRNPGDENLLNLMHELRMRLCDLYHSCSDASWRWFEDCFTYSNGIMPLALFHSLEIMPEESVQQVAKESTRFLEEVTLADGFCRPIGCESFYSKGEERSVFDQQPVDVYAKVLLFLQAWKVTGKERFYKNALLCNSWFYGKNELHLLRYDPETGGCCVGSTHVAARTAFV